jgi:hypothetical protein
MDGPEVRPRYQVNRAHRCISKRTYWLDLQSKLLSELYIYEECKPEVNFL